jgi:hypothetical protein
MNNSIKLKATEIKRGIGASYGFNGLKIAFCTVPDAKNQVKIVGYLETCRESVSGFLRMQFANGGDKYRQADLKKTRLILYVRCDDSCMQKTIENFRIKKDKEILVGLKLVNHYERKFGWTRSTLQKLDNHNYFYNKNGLDVSNCVHMYMVVGSSKWQKSPALLSLYMLLLRLGTRGFDDKFNTHEEFLKKLESFAGSYGGDSNKKSDIKFVSATYKKWDILLENYNRLFKNRTIKSLYSIESLVNGDTGFNEGIWRLCTGRSYDLGISHKFAEICKENNIEMKIRVKKEDRQE